MMPAFVTLKRSRDVCFTPKNGRAQPMSAKCQKADIIRFTGAIS